MRKRTTAAGVGLLATLVALAAGACSGDAAGVFDEGDASFPVFDGAFPDTGGGHPNDAAGDVTGDVGSSGDDAGGSGDAADAADAVGDANDGGDATLDGALSADGADAADANDAAADADAAPPSSERLSPGCPVGLALGASTLYWSENIGSNGCSPAVRACPVTGCSTLPAAIYTGASGQSLPIGVAAVSGSPDEVFYADDQFQHANLWKMDADGGAMTAWGTSTVAPAPAITDGTSVFWGSAEGVFRSAVATSGATKVLAGAPDSISPQAIALDDTNVYIATGGSVVSCPKASNCSDGSTTATVIATATGVHSMWSDGTTLFFGAFATGHDLLYRCPVAGCPAATPIVFADTATASAAEQFGTGVTTDAADVYWGTTAGTIYVCAKGDAAPCSPTPWVATARPLAMVHDATYLYWSDARDGVYRVPLR